jgi:hypothetical protein
MRKISRLSFSGEAAGFPRPAISARLGRQELPSGHILPGIWPRRKAEVFDLVNETLTGPRAKKDRSRIRAGSGLTVRS